MIATVHARYSELKEAAKEALQASKERSELEDELMDRAAEIEHRRGIYDTALALWKRGEGPEPSKDGVDLRGVEELEAALQEQHVLLDMASSANPAIMEEYEKRERDVSPFLPHGLKIWFHVSDLSIL